MMTEINTQSVLIILGILLLISIIGGCYCSETFADVFKSNKTSILNVDRPNHPKWYEDIPESHPEVLSLIKQTKEQAKRVKTYTPKGFEKIQTPPEVQKYLESVALTVDRTPEKSNNIFRRTSSGLPPYLLKIPGEKRQWIHDQLKPIMEKWSGLKLKPTSAYGPREYRRGSSLRMHVDTEATHVISGILHIYREGMDSDWPLVVINRQGERESVFMKPGELVLYESASLPHSREQPLNGDYYVNMFVHYQPVDESHLLKK